MRVVVGNDGTGKTTLVSRLRERGYDVSDRGLPTKATDSSIPLEPLEGEIYLVLDCAPETSQRRLASRGADLTEEFHTLESLVGYRVRFVRACAELGVLGHLVAREEPEASEGREGLRVHVRVDDGARRERLSLREQPAARTII